MRNQARASLRGSGLTGPFFALVVLFGVVAAVIVLNRRLEQPDPVPAPEVEVDPFADWESEVPPGTAPKPAPFRASNAEVDEAVWDKAQKTAEEADGLMEEAIAALKAGERERARQTGKQAEELLNRCLEASLPYEEGLVAAQGEESSDVRRVRRVRDGWRRQIVALKKSAGL